MLQRIRLPATVWRALEMVRSGLALALPPSPSPIVWRALEIMRSTESIFQLWVRFKKSGHVAHEGAATPLPSRGGAGVGSVISCLWERYWPHPNPSPTREGSGCAFVRDMLWLFKVDSIFNGFCTVKIQRFPVFLSVLSKKIAINVLCCHKTFYCYHS